jgi:actin-like ATPase involved in cell morphogenesis
MDLVLQLKRYLRNTHNLLIGDLAAARVVREVNSVLQENQDQWQAITIRGRNLISGFPNGVELTIQELATALSHPQQSKLKRFVELWRYIRSGIWFQ